MMKWQNLKSAGIVLIIWMLILSSALDILSSQWPSPGETIRESSDISIKVNNPKHGSTVYCEPGKLRANISFDIDTFIDQGAQSETIDLSDYLLEVTLQHGVQQISRVDLATFYDQGAALINVLPGDRLIGISLLHASTEKILMRSLLQVKVVTDTNNGEIDIHKWSSSRISTEAMTAVDKVADDKSFDRSRYFEAVYDLAYWSGGDINAKSLSGVGSQPNAALGAKRAVAEILTSKHWEDYWKGQRITRVIDVPCGDMAWMDIDLLQSMNISYLGMDIVNNVILKNQKKYKNYNKENRNISISFLQMDILTDEWPSIQSTDLLIIRALMIHQPIDANLHLLSKIKNSGVKRVLLTTHILANVNHNDFILAAGHHINLLRPPYCLCDPIVLYGEIEDDTYLGLWDLEAFPNCFEGRNKNSITC